MLAIAIWLSGCGASSSHKNPGKSASAPAAAATPSTLPDGCPQNSGFAGDDMCLSPPPGGGGFQLHYGPADYGDPTALAPFLLGPGQESTDCYYLKTPNTTGVYVGGYQLYLRPGSHHLNVDVNSAPSPDGFGTCQPNDQSPGLLGGLVTPPTLDEKTDPAPENEGLAVLLPANSQAVINFHVINAAAKTTLREAWANYFYIDPSEVKGLRGTLFLIGGFGFNIDPWTRQTFQYSCSPSRPVRILNIAAHMHAHAMRMSVWHVDKAHQTTLVYEAFDWANPLLARYDSAHTNDPSDRATQTPGASSGQLVVTPGETIQWECDINNTSDNVLTFRNEVNTGEMCIVSGEVVPADDPMTAAGFQCVVN